MSEVVPLSALTERKFIEIIVGLRYNKHGGGVTAALATSEKPWGEFGLRTSIIYFNAFHLKSGVPVKDTPFFKTFIKLVQDNKERRVRLSADKYLLDDVPKYGFMMEFNPEDLLAKRGEALDAIVSYVSKKLEES